MSKIHLVIPDVHAHYQHDNKRAEWLGNLINEVKPDVVISIGDQADMPSLSSYDRGRRSFQGRSYQADIESHLDFQTRLWDQVRRTKRRLPYRVTLIGNHEERISRAIEIQPELDGTISYDDLRLEDFYDTVVPYNGSTPGVIDLDGVHYAHYMVSGVAGRPISGEHLAYTLLTKQHVSCTVGHNHTLDYAIRTKPDGSKIMGLCCGSFLDWEPEFAGEANKLWWRGVIIKKNVINGVYDPEFVSLARLRKEYG